MSSLTIRIPPELWHILRPVVDATGEAPGKALLRIVKEGMAPPAQTTGQSEASGLSMPVIHPQALATIHAIATLMRRSPDAVFGEAVNDAVGEIGDRYHRLMTQAREKKRRRNFKSQAEARAEFEKTMRGEYRDGVWVSRASEELEREFLRLQAERAARDRPKAETLAADDLRWAEADAACAAQQEEPAR